MTCKLLIYLVPGGGLEPPRPCGLRILSPLRLPVSPSGPESRSVSIDTLYYGASHMNLLLTLTVSPTGLPGTNLICAISQVPE